MYSEALPYLCCPICYGTLQPQPVTLATTGEILTGQLACGVCQVSYPIRDGVADFLGAPQPATPAQSVNEWPATAWAYERLWRPFSLSLLSGQSFAYRRELPLIVAQVGATRGGLFVDVACSNGLYARAIAQVLGGNGHVIGIDHALPMVQEARRWALTTGLRISYVRAEAQALPIRADVAAGLVIGGSLNEIGDLKACLAEVQRVLAPHGRFVTMTLAQAQSTWGRVVQTALQPGGITFYPTEQLIAQFAQHGLPVTQHQQHGVVVFTQSAVS